MHCMLGCKVSQLFSAIWIIIGNFYLRKVMSKYLWCMREVRKYVMCPRAAVYLSDRPNNILWMWYSEEIENICHVGLLNVGLFINKQIILPCVSHTFFHEGSHLGDKIILDRNIRTDWCYSHRQYGSFTGLTKENSTLKYTCSNIHAKGCYYETPCSEGHASRLLSNNLANLIFSPNKQSMSQT